MKLRGLISKPWNPVYADYPSAYIPQKWAAEGLMVLLANTIMLPLVHLDFKNEVQSEGDVINTRRPGTFEAKRKVDGDDVVADTPTATNVQIKLDQHIYESFLIYDVASTTSFKDLVDEYLTPAMESVAQMVDQLIHAQSYQFQDNIVGKLGVAADETTIIAARTKMTNNKVPQSGRVCVLTPNTEGDLLEVAQFVNANQVGDDGSALREGHIGRKYGIDFFTSPNTPTIATGENTEKTGLVDLVAGYAIGSTSIITSDRVGGDPVAGEWVLITGDGTPQFITAFTGQTITISPGLRNAVVDDATFTIYKAGVIDKIGDYAVGWNKAVVIDDFAATKAPQSGQMVTIGTGNNYQYGAINTPTITSMYLDRSLEEIAANNAVVGLGPAGNYNFCFNKNAIAFISRPLLLPEAGTGVSTAVADYNGVGLRITIGYNMTKQAMQVTVDLLCGVKVLDTNLGCLLLG